MPATSRGVTLLGPDKLEIREYPIPDIPSDGGLVKVELGGVCGSDVKYLHGGKAQLPYPLILGHEILGRVEKLGKNAAAIHGVQEGDRIILKGAKGCGRCAHCRRGGARFCKARIGYGGQTTCANPPHLFGGFADYLYLVPDILVTKVNDDLPPEAAVLVGAVMANGFQWAVRQGGVKMGDYVLIQGPGNRGLPVPLRPDAPAPRASLLAVSVETPSDWKLPRNSAPTEPLTSNKKTSWTWCARKPAAS